MWVLPTLAIASALLLHAPSLHHVRRPQHATKISPIVMDESVAEAGDAPAEDLPAYRPPRLDDASLKIGQVVETVVLGRLAPFEGDRRFRGYVVDVGASQPALVPATHVRLNPNASIGPSGINRGQSWGELPVGAVLEAQILGVPDECDLAVNVSCVNVSFARVQRNLAWQRVTQLSDLDVTIGAKVLRMNENGATLDVEGLPAFLPWSHWSLPEEERTWKLYGKMLPVKFLEVRSSPPHGSWPAAPPCLLAERCSPSWLVTECVCTCVSPRAAG